MNQSKILLSKTIIYTTDHPHEGECKMGYKSWSDNYYSVQIFDKNEELQKRVVLMLSQVLFLLLVFDNFPDISDDQNTLKHLCKFFCIILHSSIIYSTFVQY